MGIKPMFSDGVFKAPNPNPFKIKVLDVVHTDNATIAEILYEGCTTFGGRKLVVLEGHYENLNSLDPHFYEGHIVKARFEPNKAGWKMAKVVAQII